MELFLFFLFGTLIGSFLNVVLFRFRTGQGVAGRSRCGRCAATLRWYELVPIVSFVLLRGRCRTCSAMISLQYPLVEFAHGLLYAGGFWLFGLTPPLFFLLPALSFLLLVTVYDFRHTIIPDPFSYGFSFFALLFSLSLHGVPALPSIFVSGMVVALPLYLLYALSSGKWLGFGDVKLAVGIGFLLGVSSGFVALLLAFWIGAAFSLAHLAVLFMRARLKGERFAPTMNHEVPFGPYLVLATLFALFGNLSFAELLLWFTF